MTYLLFLLPALMVLLLHAAAIAWRRWIYRRRHRAELTRLELWRLRESPEWAAAVTEGERLLLREMMWPSEPRASGPSSEEGR